MTEVIELEKMGYQFSLMPEGKICARRPGGLPTPEGAPALLASIKARRDEAAAFLRQRAGTTVQPTVKTHVFALNDKDMLARWKDMQARGMAQVEHVRVFTRRGVVEVDYVPLVEPWVIEAEVSAA